MEIREAEFDGSDRNSLSEMARTRKEKTRVATYVDFANVWMGATERGVVPDIRHIMDLSKGLGQVVIARAYICSAVKEAVKPGVLNIMSSGFEIVTRYTTNTNFGLKKDIDTSLVSDLIEDLYTVAPDVIVIASDDSDFSPAIIKAKKKGVYCISLVSSLERARVLVGISSSSIELSFEKEIKADTVYNIIPQKQEGVLHG